MGYTSVLSNSNYACDVCSVKHHKVVGLPVLLRLSYSLSIDWGLQWHFWSIYGWTGEDEDPEVKTVYQYVIDLC